MAKLTKRQEAQSGESSEDEAPEEESFSTSAKISQQKAREVEKLIKDQNKASKQKRRERDAQLRDQKKKLLSEILAEVDDEPASDASEPPKVTPARVHKKPVKLEAEKDGITVKVAPKRNTRLPPASSSSLLQAREQFLTRKGIERR